MKVVVFGIMSVFLALLGYNIYEFIKKKWFNFSRKEYLQLIALLEYSNEVSDYLWKNFRAKLGPLSTYNKKGEEVSAGGLKVSGVNNEDLAKIRENLPKEYLIFVIDYDPKAQSIGILKGYDKYLILKNMQTSGEDEQHLTTGRLINELKLLDRSYPFLITGANYDWVELEFKELPEDIDNLIAELQKICPAQISEKEHISAAKKELLDTRRVFLWWDKENEKI